MTPVTSEIGKGHPYSNSFTAMMKPTSPAKMAVLQQFLKIGLDTVVGHQNSPDLPFCDGHLQKVALAQ